MGRGLGHGSSRFHHGRSRSRNSRSSSSNRVRRRGGPRVKFLARLVPVFWNRPDPARLSRRKCGRKRSVPADGCSSGKGNRPAWETVPGYLCGLITCAEGCNRQRSAIRRKMQLVSARSSRPAPQCPRKWSCRCPTTDYSSSCNCPNRSTFH